MRNKKYIKGLLEDIVLKMISTEGEMYGYELTRKVSELTNGAMKITEGALYPVLHRLENNGMLSSTMKEFDGRIRKYYSLTESGDSEVVGSSEGVEEFINGLQNIFNLKPSSQ